METRPRFSIQAALAIAVLLAINIYLVKKLFVVEFTDNMQTNAGTFMAISRFIVQNFPHLDWYPWWNNGLPFENSYTPMLHLIDAAFAWITGSSTARAFNFVTACFYAAGPTALFLFAWRVSRAIAPSFVAALLYSLFSPIVMFQKFRLDIGVFDPWRLRVLASYGEGPHITVLCFLPLMLLAVYRALETPSGLRKYLWCCASAILIAFLALVNAFGMTDAAIGCACLIAVRPFKEIGKAIVVTLGIGIAAYLWASPFLTPTLLHTVSQQSQYVSGDYRSSKLLTAQGTVVVGFLIVWLATWRMRDAFLRFCLLFAFVFYAVVALDAVFNLPALPQAFRYSTEMEISLPLAVVFALAPVLKRLPRIAKIAGLVILALASVHQLLAYRLYGRAVTQKLDVTQTTEYRAAQWLDRNLHGLRAFVSGETGLWLNVFTDSPQMTSGHQPFNPNPVLDGAVYAIYADQTAGDRAAETSILWLKAYGCHAIHVAPSRFSGQIFALPHKFDGVLPVLWHEGDATIYAVPERTRSLAHIVPEAAIVSRPPIHGLDTAGVARYVAALDDPALPDAPMTWLRPSSARIETVIHPGQVISVQSTYDKGWIATANGRPAPVTKDGIGLSVIHPACDGPCNVDFVFDGGLERKICRILSWSVTAAALLGLLFFRRRRQV